VIEAVQAIEQDLAAQAAAEAKDKANERPMSDLEIAWRIAFALHLGPQLQRLLRSRSSCGCPAIYSARTTLRAHVSFHQLRT
jgi:hypothetical protein